MGELDRNHYIQKRLLDNFATLKDNGKYKICLLDLCNFKVEYRNTDRAFYSKNLYDINDVEDAKILERKFKEKIEDPMGSIVEKLIDNSGQVILKRFEIETIKKYILLQYYRNIRNREGYINSPNGSIELSSYNIKENETKVDFWKREMLTILDNDWDYILQYIEMVGIKKYSTEINQSFLMFFSTNEEFCINDIGYVTERIPIKLPDALKEEYINNAKLMGSELFGVNDFEKIAKREIENEASYIDNLTFFPIASNFAIGLINPIWKFFLLNPQKMINTKIPFFSNLLLKHLSLPQNNYIYSSKIKDIETLVKNKSPDDLYTYQIHKLSIDESLYCNHLIINEAFCYIGFKTPERMLFVVKTYNELESKGEKNLKKNLKGYYDLITSLVKH